MTVAEFVGALGFDVDEKSAGKAQAALDKVEKGVLALSAVAVGAATALGVMVKSLADQASRANDSAEALGVNAAALQELGYAAHLSGSSADELEGSLSFLTKRAADAAEGSDEAAGAFSKLGVSVRDANGKVKTGDALLLELADKFQGLPPGIETANKAMDVFGRTGNRLVPFLRKGSSGINELRQEARDLGIVLDQDTLDAGDALGDSFDRLGGVLGAVRNVIAGPLLTPVKRLVDAFTSWWRTNQAIVKQRVEALFERLGQATSKLVPLADAADRAFQRVLDGIKWVTDDADRFRAALVIVGGLFVGLGIAAVASGISAAVAWLAAAAPFILLGILIAALVDDINTFTEGGESLIGDFVFILKDFWTEIRWAAITTWQAITDAIDAALNWISSTASAVWTFLKDAFWALFVQPYIDAFDLIRSVAGTVFDWLAEVFGPLGDTVSEFSTEAVGFFEQIGEAFAPLVSAVMGFVDEVVGVLNALAELNAAIVSRIVQWWFARFDEVVAFLSGVFDTITGYVSDFIESAVAYFAPLFMWLFEQWENFKLGLALIVEAAIAWLTERWEAFKGFISSLVMGWVASFTSAFLTIRERIGAFIDWVRERFAIVREAIVNALTGALDTLAAPIRAVTGLLSKVKGGISSVTDFVTGKSDGAAVVRGVTEAAATPGGVPALFGGGASPSAAVAASSASDNRRTEINAPVDVKVQAAPGQSVESVGAATADAIRDGWKQSLVEAAATVPP